MRRLVTLGLAFLTVGGSFLSPGQNASAAGGQTSASDQDVGRILDKYIQAIGGKGTLEMLRTRRMTGRVSSAAAQVAGRVQIDQKAPNKWLEKDSFLYNDPPPKDHSERQMAFDGTGGWTAGQNWWSAPGRIEDMDAGTLAERNLVFDLKRPLRLKELYRSLKLAGTQEVESDHSREPDRAGLVELEEGLRGVFPSAALGPVSQAYVVDATKADGKIDKLYFDAKTGLLLRCDLGVPPGHYGLTWFLEDYRAVNGAKVPYRLIYRQDFSRLGPGVTLVDTTFVFDEVYTNISLDDAEFERPRGRS